MIPYNKPKSQTGNEHGDQIDKEVTSDDSAVNAPGLYQTRYWRKLASGIACAQRKGK